MVVEGLAVVGIDPIPIITGALIDLLIIIIDLLIIIIEASIVLFPIITDHTLITTITTEQAVIITGHITTRHAHIILYQEPMFKG
jgi:hypothetical protein